MDDEFDDARYEADEKHTWRLIATGLAGLFAISIIATTAVALYINTFNGGERSETI